MIAHGCLLLSATFVLAGRDTKQVHVSIQCVMLAGGAAATRRLVWSRFRLTNTLRDDGPLLTSCCFLRGFETLVAGTASGELKLHDAYKCVLRLSPGVLLSVQTLFWAAAICDLDTLQLLPFV